MIRVVQECGQKWYRKSSWYRSYPNYKYNNIRFRKLTWDGKLMGIAFGPIMIYWRKYA